MIFDFRLYETQIKTIYILHYKWKLLLLLAKIGFEKSIIFQLIFFLIVDPL